MRILVIFLFLSLFSCTTFSEYSKFNELESCGETLCINNAPLNLQYKTFGAFRFANNKGEYRKMKVRVKPNFKNIITYGRSATLKGDYYLLLNNEKFPDEFQYKDTIINNRKITIALSKKINLKSNTDFLLNFSANK